MVQAQIAARGVRDRRVLEAMGAVPREQFVSWQWTDRAYDDAPLPIGHGQTISQPYIVALMIEAMEIAPTDRVLEVGSGSGYAAAIMSQLADAVYAMERHADLTKLARQRLDALGCDNVAWRCGDGTRGWQEAAPFDAILVSAGGPHVPPSLKAQLAVGGRLVIPIGEDPKNQELWCCHRVGQQSFKRRSLGRVRFVPLVGSEGWHPQERTAES